MSTEVEVAAKPRSMALAIGLPGDESTATQWNDTRGYVSQGSMIIATPASGEQAMDLAGARLEIGDATMDARHKRTVSHVVECDRVGARACLSAQ